ncbi:hypothetical protein ACJMK2_002294 [Sinanodonta woodiana]|uniref:HTH psq-type domain-containing protein n=1 Tax=Sinanodonta woodiana TaxID=1069815 RepID=A0ABD3XX40_SINWO
MSSPVKTDDNVPTPQANADHLYDNLNSPTYEMASEAQDSSPMIDDPEAKERQMREWRAELEKVEQEITTLRQVLGSKVRYASELKRKLGISPLQEMKQDFSEGLKFIKESDTYQKTSAAAKSAVEKTSNVASSIGASVSRKLGDIRNSDTFKSLEVKVESTYASVKRKRKKESRTPNGRYRSYPASALISAYFAVINGELSTQKAAKHFGVPTTTLMDRIDGKIPIEKMRSGPPLLFTDDEEMNLAIHMRKMALIGYKYLRNQDILKLATDYAIYLNKRNFGEPLSKRWLYSFYERWPQLNDFKPGSSLKSESNSAMRCLRNYYKELLRLMNEYKLQETPENIYILEERPVISDNMAQSEDDDGDVTEKVHITVLGCGNAVGAQIPPYFVFAGTKMKKDLLHGAVPGADGIVNDTGRTDTDVYMRYLKSHFMEFVDSEQPVMVLYNGSCKHITLSVIEWAKQNNIILYVLPPGTVSMHQPGSEGLFGPFETIYAEECQVVIDNLDNNASQNDICRVACRAYTHALSACNLQAAFRNLGIYPFASPIDLEESVDGEDEDLNKIELVEQLLEQNEATEQGHVVQQLDSGEDNNLKVKAKRKRKKSTSETDSVSVSPPKRKWGKKKSCLIRGKKKRKTSKK